MSLSFEDEMMKKIAQGCSKSFGRLFEAYGSLVLGYAFRLTQEKATAEDISQEVWLKIVKLAPSYQAQGQFKSWVFTITRNLCFNKLKADKRLEFHEDISDISDSDVSGETAEDILIQKNKVHEVQEFLKDLPEPQRIGLLLVTVEGLSYEDVAQELNLSLGATKSIIHRARKALVEKFGKEIL